MHEKKQSKFRLGSIVIVAIAGLLGFFAVTNSQLIVDYVRSIQYQPSASASTIRDKLDLTHTGTLYFNASETALESADQFNTSCQQSKETNNPIVGCYVAQRIFIYDITNQKLDGIEETTAAHELLHAAYERLSETDKMTLDEQLLKVYEQRKTPALEERMEYYREAEPGQEMNELHSILGSEFANLGATLEAHYAQYFNNRQAVLAYYNQYNSVFESVSTRLKQLSSEVNTRTEAVNKRIVRYNQDARRLEQDAAALNSKQFSSYGEYESERSELLQRQAELDQTRTAINTEITAINRLRTQYNLLVEEYNQLNVSLNSSLTPVKSLN